MRKRAYHKNIRREIGHTFGRFICIFLIAALGVAFFTGIRVCEPDMMKSADRLFDETSLMDVQIISTGGLTQKDVEAIRNISGVEAVMPAYSVDMLEHTDGEQNVIKVMSVPDELNKVKLVEGRMPSAPNECLVDQKMTGFYADYGIGDKISVVDGKNKDEASLAYEDYEIVGVVISPLYLDFGRGSTSLGSGSVLGFMYVPEEAFTQDYYSVIYVTGKGFSDELSYTDTYQTKVDELVERIEAIADERCKAREDDLRAEADEEIGKARAELEDAKADAAKELADARAELDDGYKKLEDARAEIADAQLEIKDNEQKLADARTEFKDKEQQVIDAEAQIADAEAEFTSARDALNDGWGRYDTAVELFEAQRPQLENSRAQVATAKAEYEAMAAFMSPDQQMLTEAALAAMTAKLTDAETQFNEGMASLEAIYKELDDREDAYKEAYAEFEVKKAEVADARAQLEDGRTELEEAEAELENGRQELAKALEEVADAEKELADGEVEYADGEREADEKIADAEQKLADAEAEVEELIKTPTWYVLDRDYITSVSEFGLNAEKIGAIGKVFPVIFFLVAILVCLTTMTRMVEEQRTEIGTLKALGYSDFRVAWKFILYCLLASVFGSAFGACLGEYVLPYCIIRAYYILYNNIPYLHLAIDPQLSIIAGLIACACTLLATLLACGRATSEKAAELMRPVAPLPGKRVFMERIGFIWKRLSFTMKASVRNLLRYKKRFMMTVIGIGGCMALMLVGFGLHDSIFTIIDNQFYRIMVYDGIVSLNNDDAEKVDELISYVRGNDSIEECMLTYQTATNVGANGVEKEAYIVVPSEPETFNHYIYMGDRRSKESFDLSDYPGGVVINEKLANLLGVKIGDTIYVTNEDNLRLEVAIAQITENYVYNYVYMVPAEYERVYGEAAEYNVLYFNEKENVGKAAEESFGREVLMMDAAAGINYSQTSADTIYDMMSSLNFVVYVLVIAAALLAFVVLYNLSNININERRRELATLKVLGFYDGEISAYVYRENIMLTVIGILIGVVIGIFLHRYVILTAEVDMTLFGRQIKPLSYLYSAGLTMVFAALVNWIMHFRLKRIDMVESLKSIE